MKLLILLFLVSTALAVKRECYSKNEDLKNVDKFARTKLYNGQLNFTLNLFNLINEKVPDDNIIFSPFSVYHALLLGYIAAGGQTEKALKQSLLLPDSLDKPNILMAYKVDKQARNFNNNSVSYEFTNVNKMFVDNGLHIRECMLPWITGELQPLDFHNNPSLSRTQINDWVARVTKNNIKDLIPMDGITSSSKLVLANAAYFKGVWASKFQVEMTKRKPFYLTATQTTLVPFMRQKGQFHYTVNEELGAQVLELPYKGNDISMYILLPPYTVEEGVTNIISHLTPERLAAVVDEGVISREVVVEIPKFTAERTLPMKDIMERLGVGDLFQGAPDFSTLTEDSGIAFDDAIHKAKIKLDEEGTEAAAATAIFGFRSSRPQDPTIFIANFPFVYIIYEKPTKSVLFMGVCRNPKK